MNRTIFILFIFILIFSPLAFGSVESWSIAIMEVFSISAFCLLLLKKLVRKELFIYEVPGIVPLIFLLSYILMQLIPLPAGIIKIISPETYNLYRETIFIDKPAAWLSISINKKATLVEFLRMASYTVFYVLTVQLLSRKYNLQKTIGIIIIYASLLSLFGIIQHFLSNNKIFWFRELMQGGSPFGPYTNRNHYAGLMGMLFPLILSLFLFYKPRFLKYKSFRDKITGIFNIQRTNIYILVGFSSILIGTSIFLTLSRSGIVSLCLSMIVFGMMFLAKGSDKRRGVLIIVICILIVLSVGWFGWGPIIEKFESVRNKQGDISDMRLQIWKDSSHIIQDFPLTGTGFGSFIDIYPKYRTIKGDNIVEHAHNDFIELLSNGGLIAFLIFAWFLFSLLYKSYKTYLKRHEMYSVYIFIAAVTGMISILIHGITDFNLNIGANGLYFFFMAGLAVSAANTRVHEGLNDTYLKKMKVPLRILTISVVVLLLLDILFSLGINIGKLYFSSIKDLKLNEKISNADIHSARDSAYMASFFDPLEAKYQYAVANIEIFRADKTAAVGHYKKAVELDPVNGEYLQRLGLIMSELKQYAVADRLLQSGIKYDAGKPARHKRYALWLFSRGEKDAGIKIVKTAISMEPQKTREYITLMVLNGLSDEDILNSLPERVEPHLLFASYLYRTGKDKMAEEEYLNALRYINNEETINPSYFYEVYNYYLRKNYYWAAVKVMRKAAEFLPSDAGIRVSTGDLFEKLKLPDKAIEEYKYALVIDPKSGEAKKRLELLMKDKGF